MILMPRPYRLAAAWITILWQVLILLTSNHNFFNLLTIALCLFLFDDRALARVLPRGLAQRGAASPLLPERPSRRAAAIAALVAAITVPASLVGAAAMVPGVEPPRPLLAATDWVGRFRIANRYHVFPTIDRERIEVQIEASQDGLDWRPYRFRYWPVELNRMTPFAVPHQPRLDWMLWFVPKSPVFADLLDRLLGRLAQASPPVLALLGPAPFGAEPPRWLRVEFYRYRFATAPERATTGDWWRRDPLGPL
jgi:hypothetical protein